MLDKLFVGREKSIPRELHVQSANEVQPQYPYLNATEFGDTYGRHPWVYSTIFEVSTSCSNVPIHISIQENIVESGPLFDLMKRPNPFTTNRDFREAHFIFMESMGECFWYLVGASEDPFEPISSTNPPFEIYLLRPDKMTVIPDKENFIGGFKYNLNGSDIVIPANKVLYFKYFNPIDQHRGLSPLKPAELSIVADLNAQKYNAVFFNNASLPNGMFVNKSQVAVSDQVFKRIKKQVEEQFNGVKKWHKPLVVDGYEWVDTVKKFRDMEFEKLRKMNKSEIASAIGVPESLIGDRSQMNRATSETEERIFWEKTIIPKCRKFQDSLTMFFEPIYGEFEFKHDFSGIAALSAGFEEKFDALSAAVGGPWLKPSEARDISKNQFGFMLDEVDDSEFERTNNTQIDRSLKKKQSLIQDIMKDGYPGRKSMKIAI